MQGSPQWLLLRKAVGGGAGLPPAGHSSMEAGEDVTRCLPSIYEALGSIPSARVGGKKLLWD